MSSSVAPAAAAPALSLSKRWAHHDGELRVYSHASARTAGTMTFSLFLPRAALEAGAAPASIPVIYWLSGLTCTWENFSTKSGAFAHAAAHGVAIVAPDTSPRGHAAIPGEAEAWSFGLGAGFYVDASEAPWRAHYSMASYVASELPAVLAAALPVLSPSRRSLMGHSMGGLGALATALRQPGAYRAVSAFAPVAHPSAAPWGRKAFATLLGADEAAWRAYDPTALIAGYTGPPLPIRIEQGGADEFLETQLLPQHFLDAAAAAGVPVTYTVRPGYDHSYFFISTFIGAHIAEHAALLRA